MVSTPWRYFKWSLLVTVAGLVLAAWLGWAVNRTMSGILSFLLVGTVLAALEISLSFDNAIVNANKLQSMTPLWQRRFLTWGIVIAVFGMRLVFPLAVVAVAAGIGPVQTLSLAIHSPQQYARILEQSDLGIAAFGGAFLMMVALDYFIDEAKEVHWIRGLEKQLRRCAPVRGIQMSFVLAVILAFTFILPAQDVSAFLFSALLGVVVFTLVEIVGQLLDDRGRLMATTARGGLGAFLYLEVLDGSFSFDGVIGAFALTQNLFLIGIGLGIGAMYVRSMTIMLVERRTLAHFRYLEHGAFYSILALSIIMFAQTFSEIPDLVTGLVGVGLIGVALWSSVRYNRSVAPSE